jgi:hypothetical protein
VLLLSCETSTGSTLRTGSYLPLSSLALVNATGLSRYAVIPAAPMAGMCTCWRAAAPLPSSGWKGLGYAEASDKSKDDTTVAENVGILGNGKTINSGNVLQGISQMGNWGKRRGAGSFQTSDNKRENNLTRRLAAAMRGNSVNTSPIVDEE